jgi:hypothetical protein
MAKEFDLDFYTIPQISELTGLFEKSFKKLKLS